MKLGNRKNVIVVGIILCIFFVCFASRATLIFIGNSYENSQDINVAISLDNNIVYNGVLKAYEFPLLIKKMKVGFYKVSAKLNNIEVENEFFYFFQKTIWIDFDFTTKDILLISKFYRQVPL